MKSEIIILSIHPSHVEKILSGEKLYEYRKRIPNSIRYVVVYASYPIKKIVALIEVEKVLKNTPTNIWQETKEHAGISHHFFLKYFENREVAYAIKFKKVFQITPLLALNLLGYNKGPQSFIYLNIDVGKIKSIMQV